MPYIYIKHGAIKIYNLNTLRPKQNGGHFADDIFKCIFLNENTWISVKISPKFVPKGPIKNIPALVQIMAWRRPGAKPLSEPMMVSLPTDICVTRPQWVKLKQDMIYYAAIHNPFCAETRIFHDNKVNTRVVDALAHCIVMPWSDMMVFDIQDKCLPKAMISSTCTI